MKNTNDTQNKISIVINDSDSKKNHKNKDEIGQKIQKIELLKKQLENLTNEINTVKSLYSKHVNKEENNLFITKEKLILKLYERYQQKSFTVWQKELLEEKIINEINFLHEESYQSQKLAEIYEEITRLRSENLGDFEKNIINEMAKDHFKNMGVDIDLEDFDFTSSDFRENFEQKFADQYSKQQEQQKHEKQEEKIKTTDKDFQKLYRSLVKKAHPDLVIDSKDKEQREEWMKKLSLAWEGRNYYQLLLLQKEIDSDASFEVSLDKNQLKSLINQLNKEIRNLETDKYILKNQNPDTSFYYQNFYARSTKGILKKINTFNELIKTQCQDTNDEYNLLKTQKSTKDFLSDLRGSINTYDDLFNYL